MNNQATNGIDEVGLDDLCILYITVPTSLFSIG